MKPDDNVLCDYWAFILAYIRQVLYGNGQYCEI